MPEDADGTGSFVIAVTSRLTGGVLRHTAPTFFDAPDTPVGAHQFFDLRGAGVTR